MSRTGRPEKLSDRKHEDILAAAVRAFGEMGFDATSMDKIASIANVSKRTVYNHFPSKDLLFEAIVENLKISASSAATLEYSSSVPLRDQLIQFAVSVMHFHCHPCSRTLARILVSRFIRTPKLGEVMFGKSKVFELSLVHWLDRASQDSKLRVSELGFAARQLLGMIEAFSVWPQLLMNEPNPDAPEIQRVAEQSVDLFLSFYERKSEV